MKDEFCTLNPKTHKIEYQEPSIINLYEHEGPMYHIANTLIDQLVTLDHKMYVKKRYSKKYEFLKPDQIKGKRVRYVKNGTWKSKKKVVPKEFDKQMDTFEYASLMGWYLSEGSSCKTSNGYVTDICQSPIIHKEYYDEIAVLVRDCGFTPIYCKDRIRFNGKAIHLYLKPFGHAHEKFVPQNIKNASPRIIQYFLDAYIKGDGHINKTNQAVITTSSVKMRDDLMELFLKVGESATYQKVANAGDTMMGNAVNYDIWNVRQIRTKNYPQVNHGHVHQQNGQIEEIIQYSGKVGCPTTENGVVYIRRNGKTSWTGNSGRYGNKYIVTKIIGDSEAPHREDGTPIDIMLNAHGVPSRMNIGQILETAAGKIAAKTGKPYIVDNFRDPDEDVTQTVINDLKKHGIEPDEILTDGKSGKAFAKPIFVGKQYFMKLRHIVKKKQGVRNLGTYDIDEQPVGKGAQTVGTMETYGYLAHGAKKNLQEIGEIKGRANEEYWRSIQFGLVPPKPARNFVFDKMLNYIEGLGVNITKKGNQLRISPLTDEDVLKKSNGKLLDPGALLIGKNLTARKGGLYDREITGGVRGTHWSHIELASRISNPMYADAIMKILGLTQQRFEDILEGKEKLNELTGMEAIIAALSAIKVDSKLLSVTDELVSAPPTNVNKLNTLAKYLRALKDLKLRPEEAYTMKYVPVLPPVYRPTVPLPSGDLAVSDINKHYRDIGIINTSLLRAKKDLTKEDVDLAEYSLYNTVKAMQGFIEPTTYGGEQYKGILKEIGKPKVGLIQGKTWSKRQDVSARSTITVEPSLGLDEVGIPRKLAYKMFRPFVIQELKQSGLKAVAALKNYEEESPLAWNALKEAVRKRPVILNRAPSLHKHSIQAFKPVLIKGKAIAVNSLIHAGLNLDHDGDTMSIMTPVGPEAIAEARHMYPSKILFKHGDNSVVPGLGQEYIYGLYQLSLITKKTDAKYKTIQAAKKAKISWTEQFFLNGKEMTIGQYLINHELPDKLKEYDRAMDKKTISKLLTTLAKSYNKYFSDVIESWKDLGAMYAYRNTNTISIKDFDVDRSYRNAIIEKELPAINRFKGENRIKKLNAMTLKIQDAQNKKFSKSKNNIFTMLRSGSFSKPDSVRQIISMPGVLTDVHGKPIPYPVLKSYGEGLDTASYYSTLYAVRKGTVDRAVNTQDSGALNKALLNVTRRLLITVEDCDTKKGIYIQTDSPDVLDRYLAKTITGIGKRNDIVDSTLVGKAKKRNRVQLYVRSPLTCEAVEGICQSCYGLMPNGQPASVGTNVGVLESQSVTERSTQLVMQSFHSGGSALAGGGIQAGFPRLEQLLKVPVKLPGKATLSTVRGKVKKIDKNLTGGYNVRIEGYGTANDKDFTIPSGRLPLIKVNDQIDKGDVLSDGIIKPQELGELKGHLVAQRYLVDEAHKVYGGNFFKKTFETVIRGISDNAEVTKAPEKSGFLRGDKTTVSNIKFVNKKRKAEGLERVEYVPYFKSIETLNTDVDDWLTRISTNRVKAGLTVGAAKGLYANLKGKDPIPAYIYGDNFGRNTKYEKGEFY
jgi:DNA-directed RNA polymerase subunit beta'